MVFLAKISGNRLEISMLSVMLSSFKTDGLKFGEKQSVTAGGSIILIFSSNFAVFVYFAEKSLNIFLK